MVAIQKRSGEQVSFNPNKILSRIKKAAKGLNISSDEIFIKVITSLPTEGAISTKELDKLIAEISASYTGSHHDYSKLAANISISSYYKETAESFSETMKTLSIDGIINKELIEMIEKYGAKKVDAIVNHERDNGFDYFAWRSLQEMYLLKNSEGKSLERPQHMYLRVALWVTKSLEQAKEYYESLSKQLISPATPIMINSGTKMPQLASCVLKFNDADSRDGLLNTLRDISVYSADAAGIGLCMSNVRSKESRISTSGGHAGGLLKYLKIVNESLRFFNQQGRRPGSAAIYLEPWHKDIFDLLEIKKNTGPEELRARDLFTALWVPDNFMRAVESNGDWYLFCPDEIKKAGLKAFFEIYGEEYETEYNKAVEMGLGKKIKAQDVWLKIIESQVETGVPYLAAKDNANKKSNHQNIGTIRQSNLCCLDGGTLITVRDKSGVINEKTIKEVSDLFNEGNIFEVLSENEEFMPILMADMTREDADLLEVFDEEKGVKLICTPDHLIYTKNRGYVMAQDLKEDDEMEFKQSELQLQNI